MRALGVDTRVEFNWAKPPEFNRVPENRRIPHRVKASPGNQRYRVATNGPTRSSPTCKKFLWILVNTVSQHFKMKMQAGGLAHGAHLGNFLATFDQIAFFDRRL